MTDLAATIAGYWNDAASDFDQEPDHGLLAAETRAAWAARLAGWLPAQPAETSAAGRARSPCSRPRPDTG
jgi:hypothetical protein